MKGFKLWSCAAFLLLCTHAAYAGLEQLNLDVETIKLLNVETGQVLRSLTNHASSVDCVAFSPDGKILASASFDKTIKLWEVATGKELATLAGHTQSVNSVAFNPDGTILASASDDGTVKLWDIAHRTLIATLTGHTAAVDCVAFSPKGEILASSGVDKTIRLWNTETRTLLKEVAGHENEVTSIAFSPDGKILASGSTDQTVRLWNPNTGQLIKTMAKESAAVSAIAFSPDGKTLAVGGPNIRLWDVSSGGLLGPLAGHFSYVKTLSFSPDGKTLASGSIDSKVRLWDVGAGNQIRVFGGNSFGITSVAFSPDGKTLATGSVLGSLSESASLYILTIGINKYSDSVYNLRFAVADARDFADAIERAGQGLFKRINKQVLLDEGATQASIKAAFDKVIAEARPQDVFVFHYAGLDGLSKDTSTKPAEFYLVPSDFSLADRENNEVLEAKGVSASVLRARLTAVMSRKQFIVLDTCSSAKAFEAFVSQVGDEVKTRHHAPRPGAGLRTLSEELKRNIMVVASEGEAYEFPKLGHGLLTYALLQGLNGEANEMRRLFSPFDAKDKDITRAHALATFRHSFGGDAVSSDSDLITTSVLEAYIYSKVLFLGRQLGSGKKMRPRVYASGDDFALGYAPKTHTVRTRADLVRPIEPKKPAATRTGKDYALIFATSDYNDASWPYLPNPHNDALDLKKVLEDQYGFTVDLQENKNKSEIEATLVKYMNEKKFADEDQLFVFIAGHGTYNEAIEQGFVVAKDSKSRAEDPLNQTCIRHSDIYNLINKIQCKHILVVLDVCFGGTFGNVMRTGGGADYQAVSKLERIQRAMKLQCRKYITSGGKEFVSDGSGRNSPFAYWLLDVLRRGGEEGVLTFEDIYRSVKKVSTSQPVGAAMPTDVPGSDFLLIAKAS